MKRIALILVMFLSSCSTPAVSRNPSGLRIIGYNSCGMESKDCQKREGLPEIFDGDQAERLFFSLAPETESVSGPVMRTGGIEQYTVSRHSDRVNCTRVILRPNLGWSSEIQIEYHCERNSN